MDEKSRSKRTKRILSVLLVLIVIAGGLLVFNNYYLVARDNEPSQALAQLVPVNTAPIIIGPTNIADTVERISPAVVNIETSTVVKNNSLDGFFNDPFFKQFFGNDIIIPQENMQKGIGSGFIISEDGYVLTNQHVIDNANSISVTVSGNNKKYAAQVVGQDYELDLAVLKIQSNQKFATINMGDSSRIRAGEWVVAIGNPYGLDHTVTVGVISATGRPMKIENRVYKNLIQTDAAINPGNSGGPLLNTSGEVIGINTAVNAQAQGIGFAISINTAKDVLNELIQKGKVVRPYMGVLLQPIDQNIATYLKVPNRGVVVADIVAGSPAAIAGLQKYDVITNIEKKPVDNYDQLQEVLKTKQVGDNVKLSIIRNGKNVLVPLTLAEKP
ncbi:MAG: trypsin-like peptidase domain-containing protein [Fermentimonas sp.]|nr:trypsin-like peptidase domain-containing protein [Fermentimonas sp.]